MKKNLVPLIGIAFVVAIISTGIFYGLFVGRLNSGADVPGRSIVVAARNMDRGVVLQQADGKLTPWGLAEIPQGAFTSLDQIGGLTLISSLQENEPVVQARVASDKSGTYAGLGIAPGMRAISVHATDSTGIVNILRPGHKVDVQLVSSQGSTPELRTILQNIEVLSVIPTDGRNAAPVITLLVNPQGADMVGLGDSSARLRLILRNPLDKGQSDLERVSLPGVMQKPGAKK